MFSRAHHTFDPPQCISTLPLLQLKSQANQSQSKKDTSQGNICIMPIQPRKEKSKKSLKAILSISDHG